MSSMTTWDHLFSLAVFVIYPSVAWRTYPGVVDRIRTVGEPARLTEYRLVIAIWLGFTAMLALMWILLARDWADLGLRWAEPWGLGLGIALGLGLLWLTNGQLRKLTASVRDHGQGPAEHVGDLFHFMPTNRRELLWFRAVAVNAGFTEELVFRGYLLWYLEPLFGTFWAALLAAVAFTIGHAYQGLANLPGIAFASVCFVGLYLLTGSLLVPIVLHAALDIVQGNAFARFAKLIEKAGAPESQVAD